MQGVKAGEEVYDVRDMLGKEIEYQFDDEEWYGGRVSKVSDCSRPLTDTRSAQLKRPGWTEATFGDGDIQNIKLRLSLKDGNEPGAWHFI
jgi:hypothetical protein